MTVRPLNLGWLSPHNPFSRHAFSGSVHHAHRALAAHPGVAVRLMGNHRPPRPWHRLLPPPAFRLDPAECEGLDGIVAFVAAAEVADLPSCEAPVLYATDATPSFLRDHYALPITPEDEAREARAIARAARTVYSSDFMADRATREFAAVLPRPPAVLSFGANLDRPPRAIPEKPPPAPLRLLFIGLDWNRKGGDTAVAAARALNARGLPARLTCVGPVPDHLRGDPDIEALGFLSKDRPVQARRLDRALDEAHLLILPTRADCTPMVVAEANAHGTPAVTSDVGGLPTLVRPGENGALVPAGSDGAAYADAIAGLMADPARYAALSRTSFGAVRERLSWSNWAARIVDMIRAERTGA